MTRAARKTAWVQKYDFKSIELGALFLRKFNSKRESHAGPRYDLGIFL